MVNTDNPPAGHWTNEALLRSEIGFWREMIDSCESTEPRESVERMRHALALAEQRLLHVFEKHRQAGMEGASPHSNVYRLDVTRRPPA